MNTIFVWRFSCCFHEDRCGQMCFSPNPISKRLKSFFLHLSINNTGRDLCAWWRSSGASGGREVTSGFVQRNDRKWHHLFVASIVLVFTVAAVDEAKLQVPVVEEPENRTGAELSPRVQNIDKDGNIQRPLEADCSTGHTHYFRIDYTIINKLKCSETCSLHRTNITAVRYRDVTTATLHLLRSPSSSSSSSQTSLHTPPRLSSSLSPVALCRNTGQHRV